MTDMTTSPKDTGVRARAAWSVGSAPVIAAIILLGCAHESDRSSTTPTDSSERASAAQSPSESGVDGPNSPARPPAEHIGGVFVPSANDVQYAAVLERIVADEGLVRYQLLATDPLKGQLDAVVAGYAVERLPDESQAQARIALWCNAYNANMLKIALEESSKPGFTTIKDVPGLFSTRTITVAGETLTLNALEDRLRALKDPRIHAVLVFGAGGCPPLRSEPYSVERLDEQLNQQSLAWLDDTNKHHPGRNGLLLSQIFEWYADDFEVEPYRGPLGFIRKHGRSGGSLRNLIRGMGGSPRIGYVPFNWTLNSARTFDQSEP